MKTISEIAAALALALTLLPGTAGLAGTEKVLNLEATNTALLSRRAGVVTDMTGGKVAARPLSIGIIKEATWR